MKSSTKRRLLFLSRQQQAHCEKLERTFTLVVFFFKLRWCVRAKDFYHFFFVSCAACVPFAHFAMQATHLVLTAATKLIPRENERRVLTSRSLWPRFELSKIAPRAGTRGYFVFPFPCLVFFYLFFFFFFMTWTLLPVVPSF